MTSFLKLEACTVLQNTDEQTVAKGPPVDHMSWLWVIVFTSNTSDGIDDTCIASFITNETDLYRLFMWLGGNQRTSERHKIVIDSWNRLDDRISIVLRAEWIRTGKLRISDELRPIPYFSLMRQDP